MHGTKNLLRKCKLLSHFQWKNRNTGGYGIPARIISLPGHTQGSIGIDIMEKELIVGDALMNMFYPTASMLYNDRDMMLQSADKISGLGERQIYFGHGKPKKNRSTWR